MIYPQTMGLNHPISAAAVLPTIIRLVVLVGPFMAAVSLRMAVVLTRQVQRMVTTITAPPVLKDKPLWVGRETQMRSAQLKRVKELQSYKRICCGRGRWLPPGSMVGAIAVNRFYHVFFIENFTLQFPEIFS